MSKRGLQNIVFITILALHFQVLVAGAAASAVPSQTALPNCPEKCGNITVPYPFGIGDNCHYNPPVDGHFYNLTCDENTNPPRLIYVRGIEVLNISTNGEFRVLNPIASVCYHNGKLLDNTFLTHNLQWGGVERIFTLSINQNLFGAIGCDTFAWFSGMRNKTKLFRSGCMTVCSEESDVADDKCSGIGCCLVSVSDGITNLKIEPKSLYNHIYVQNFNPCSVAFLMAKDVVKINEFPFSIKSIVQAKNYDSYNNKLLPVIYTWSIGTQKCESSRFSKDYLCHGNSSCHDFSDEQGYRCQCNPGFNGNPYLHDCQDIDECAAQYQTLCEKPEYCLNQIGSYTCKCPPNYHGNGTQNSPCISDAVDGNPKSVLAMIIIFSGTGIGITVSIVLGVCLYWRHQKQLLVKARRGFFRRNGGHLLHQKLSDGQDVSVDMVKIFKIEELEKATNKYSDSNVIGKGGFGVVYKGILANNQVVAIKKSLKVDADQSEQFVNEVIVLSQLNNRHVVKVLGCCLETEVPLLVYEFIDNGTLYDHLHDIRLRIAVEVAEVLSYLHTTISIPIIHRDMKSMNILLDKNYMAKVSDFGASRLVPMDQENLATMVLGTYGYLDPEYFQTSELTQKSDVYSFGVVLVELLTRQKVVSFNRPENDRCLAFNFLRKLKEERLHDILDNDIVRNGAIHHQVMEVADLAQRCLYVNGDERPTMKEVAAELQRIGRISDGSRRWSRSDVLSQEQITQETIDDSVGCYTKDSSSTNVNSSLYNSLAYGR